MNVMSTSNVAIIIPVYNEGKVIASVVKNVLKQFDFVVCVNDGSKDNSESEIAKTKARLVNHPVNMGQGAALQTGIEYALQFPQIEYFVTFDADGQHSLADAQKMLQYLQKNKVDVVLGSRFLGTAKNMSKLKKVILKLAVRFSNATSGIKLTDTHNGLRVFNRKFAEIINITQSDMSHASEIIQRIAETKTPFKELPVTITYTDYTVAKSHNPNLNAVNIVFDTLLRKLVK